MSKSVGADYHSRTMICPTPGSFSSAVTSTRSILTCPIMHLRISEAPACTSNHASPYNWSSGLNIPQVSPLAKGKESFAVQSRGDGTLAPDQGKQLYINLTSIDAKERVAKTTDEDGPDVLTNRCVNGTISNHILRHLRGVTERYGFIQRAMTSMINHNQDWRKPFHVNINPGANLQLVFCLMWPLTSNFFTSTEPINARECIPLQNRKKQERNQDEQKQS